jgi:hypothetical protein
MTVATERTINNDKDVGRKIPGSALADDAVTQAKAAMFISAEQTGTGAPQNVAHDLGVAPTKVFAAPTDTAPAVAGVYTVVMGVHTAANLVMTVTSGKKFQVMAWA